MRSGGVESAGLWISAFCFLNFCFVFALSALYSRFLLCIRFRFRLSAPAFRLLHWAACSLGILTRQNPFMRKWNFSSASFASSISLRS
jgi:hypothetical protein